MRTHTRSTPALTSITILSAGALLALSACSGSPSDSSSSGGTAGVGKDFAQGATTGDGANADAPSPGTSAADQQNGVIARSSAGKDGVLGRGATSPLQAAPLSTAALIKTGSVGLTSNHIGHVLTEVYGIVGGVGGDISQEDTSTNQKGKEVRSILVLRVPADSFDATLNRLATLDHLVSKARSEKDVTTAVADIDSRVRSAQRSITTLRRLFGRASRLGDIIRLESELSQRESDLESLQAQQRVLSDKTTMSTITMTLELPPPGANPKPKPDQAGGGFVSGIHQGWKALLDTAVAIGHGLGVVLPLGTVVLLLLAFVAWMVRRFAPHPRATTDEA